MRAYSMEELEEQARQLKEEIAKAPRGVGKNGNEIQFRVRLAYVRQLIADGEVSTPQIVTAIRAAIVKAVEDVLGRGLDGTPIPGGPIVVEQLPEGRLHSELIEFDLS